MNHFQKKQQGFDLFDFIFKNQNDSIYCASNNTNFEDVKVLVVKLFAFFLHQCRCRYFGTDLVQFHSNNRTQKHHLGRQMLLGQTDQLLDMLMLSLKQQDFMISQLKKFMKLFKFEIHGAKLNGKDNGVIKMQSGIQFGLMKRPNITKMLPMVLFGCLLPTF